MSDWGEFEEQEAAGATMSCREAHAEGKGRQGVKAPAPRRSAEEVAPEGGSPSMNRRPAAEPWKPVVERLQQEQAAQRRKLEELEREVAALKQQPEAGGEEARATPAEADPMHRWMMTHTEEMARYRGKRIAIHAQKGIIASADDYAQLDEILTRMGVPDTEITIDYIPLWFSSK